MAAIAKKRYRTTTAMQWFWESEIYDLNTMQAFLQEGEAGLIAGETTPNPEYIDSPRQRRKLRHDCMVKRQTLLPVQEAERRVAELETTIVQLMQLMEERAPFLLPGNIRARQH